MSPSGSSLDLKFAKALKSYDGALDGASPVPGALGDVGNARITSPSFLVAPLRDGGENPTRHARRP
jgi:hypothetical protein